jgi:ribosome biogenesis GTPase
MNGPARRRSAIVLEAWANRAVAEDDDGRIVAFHLPRRMARPLPGQTVELDERDELTDVRPARTRFGRGDPRGRFKPIAVDLDQALIVIAPKPAPSPDLIHRYLAACHLCDVAPIIVINKSDLPLPDQAPFDQLKELEALAYPIIRTRCRPDADIDDLAVVLTGKTTLIAGQSGVGKTSLVNELVPDLQAQTGALSTVTGKGTHTTTSARLHHLPDRGWLIDTPGVWEYGLWSMSPAELVRGFPEFLAYRDRCRFRDCSHRQEPGCAVRAAAEAGELPQCRYEAWLRLLSDQARLG